MKSPQETKVKDRDPNLTWLLLSSLGFFIMLYAYLNSGSTKLLIIVGALGLIAIYYAYKIWSEKKQNGAINV